MLKVRYLVYLAVIISGYYFFHGLSDRGYSLVSARVMHISANNSFLKKDTIFTVRSKETGELMQIHGELEPGEGKCNIYDDAVIKVTPSISGKFNKFELVRCVARNFLN